MSRQPPPLQPTATPARPAALPTAVVAAPASERSSPVAPTSNRLTLLIGGDILRRSLRARSLSVVLAFTLALFFFVSLASGSDSVFRHQVMLDAGLSLLRLFGLFLVLFNTLPLLAQEKERRTLQVMVAMGIPRGTILEGIYLGTVLTLALNFVLCGLVLTLTFWGLGVPLPLVALRALVLFFLEQATLAALILLFALLVSFLPALLLTLGSYLLGNMTLTLQVSLDGLGNGWTRQLAAGLLWLCPSFNLFDLKDVAVKAQAIPLSYDLLALAYAATLVVALLSLASAVFARQEVA